MNTATIIALAVAVAALAGVAVLVVLFASERRRYAEQLVAQRAEIEQLRADRVMETATMPRETATVAEFLITDAGTARDDFAPVDDRLVLSATLGEPLVRAAAFGHGLRRALSPRSLNRIRFEMRREVRRSRRQRRREMRQAWNDAKQAPNQAQDPAA
jgi:hypothetical protein